MIEIKDDEFHFTEWSSMLELYDYASKHITINNRTSDRFNWAGVEGSTFEECSENWKKLVYSGYSDFNLNKLKIDRNLIIKTNDFITKKVKVKNYYGANPNILDATMGKIDCFTIKKNQVKRGNTVNIIFNVDYWWKIKPKTIIECCKTVLLLVKEIEKMGYSVNLRVGNVNNKNCHTLLVKKSTESLKLGLIAYPMIHPSFLRLCFVSGLIRGTSGNQYSLIDSSESNINTIKTKTPYKNFIYISGNDLSELNSSKRIEYVTEQLTKLN